MSKTKSEVGSEKSQANSEQNQALTDKTRLENEWAVNPNSSASQTLVGTVSSENAEANALAQQAKLDEQELAKKAHWMKHHPPIIPEGFSSDISEDLDSDSDLPTPFPKSPLQK